MTRQATLQKNDANSLIFYFVLFMNNNFLRFINWLFSLFWMGKDFVSWLYYCRQNSYTLIFIITITKTINDTVQTGYAYCRSSL